MRPDVAEWFNRTRGPGIGSVVDVTDVAVSPDGAAWACTAWVRAPSLNTAPQLATGRVGVGGVTMLGDPTTGGWSCPRWSPGGDQLVVLESTGATNRAVLLGVDGSRIAGVEAAGIIEWCEWSPDGTSLAVLVAEPGAELSDTFGSGRVTLPSNEHPWAPWVASEDTVGWRRLWMWHPQSGGFEQVPLALNVWEASWAGNTSVCAIASDAPIEDAWYDARLVLVDLPSGNERTLLTSTVQLAVPRADRAGNTVAVISGRASDRGLLAGVVHTVDTRTGSVAAVDTLGVDVTDQFWRDDGALVYAGVRGFRCVVGLHTRHHGSSQIWASDETIGPGDLLPKVGPAGAGSAVSVLLEGPGRPPTAGIVDGGRFAPLLTLQNAGNAAVVSTCGKPAELSWLSSDGLEITGLLYRPAAAAKALVVIIHGGPIWCWRNAWPERITQLPLLLSRGFAVLLPNPRGSQGRGPSFVDGIVGEVGGRDADDILWGVDAVFVRGLVASCPSAVMGTSYGGFLAAWIATVPGAVYASVAISPATDWTSQHFTTNIPASDVRFLSGLPLDSDSHYTMRSALYAVTKQAAPVLLTAGALDLATPAAQASMFHRALREHGVPSEVVVYPLEGHDVLTFPAVSDHSARILDWLEVNLPAVKSARRGQTAD